MRPLRHAGGQGHSRRTSASVRQPLLYSAWREHRGDAVRVIRLARELELEPRASQLVPREPGEVLVRAERARRGEDRLEVRAHGRVFRDGRRGPGGHYFTLVPEGTEGSTERSEGSPVPGSEAARTMPFDSIPMSFAGMRFATTTTFRPTSCSAV